MKVLLPIVAMVSMLAGPAWSQKKPAKPTTSTPMVVDSAGQAVGRYIFGPNGAGVLIDYGGEIVALRLTFAATGVAWDDPNDVFFTTSNCTGPGYINTPNLTRLAAVVDQGPPPRAFIQSGNPQPVNFQSRLNNTFCFAQTGSVTAAPTDIISLASLPLYVQ
jgi:hypothetical protein